MTLIKRVLPILFALAFAAIGCSQKENASDAASTCSNATINPSASLVTTTNNNTIPIYVADPATTGTIGYYNEPLVSVTVCSPNHTLPSECQTISNILIDTGSTGLRVFASALSSNVHFTQQTVNVGGTNYFLAECELFGSGADWGSVENGDIILGNLTASNIPIQVINRSGYQMPAACAAFSPDTDPCTTGFNGILGVAQFVQDCGSDCNSVLTATNPGNYFVCNSVNCANTSCSGAFCAIPVPTAQQVSNPIGFFGAGFDNGLSITLPSIANTGATQVQGSMTIGIGAAAGNVPANTVVAYGSDPNGETDSNWLDLTTVFTSNANTTYGGTASPTTLSFIDSGSNGLFFPKYSALPTCSASNPFFCPTSTQNLTATVKGYTGAPSVAVPFTIVSEQTLGATTNSAFPTLGGNVSGVFDWGLPFFFNRTVYVGIDGKSANYNAGAATGPYWAF